MGAGASVGPIPDVITKEQCTQIVGNGFDEVAFDEIATNNSLPKQVFIEELTKRTDVFLTHDWGNENGIDNHARVAQINDILKEMGLTTWFDSERVKDSFIVNTY